MSAIKDAWARIGHWLKKNARSIKLRKGCSQSRLTKLEGTLKLELPEGFHESYLEHNGDNQIGCFPYSRFLLSLDGVAHEWQRMCELMRVDSDEDDDDKPADGLVRRMDWNAKWIPFASNDSGEYYFIDMDPGNSGTSGQVVSFSHEEGPVRVLGTSFETFLVEYAQALEQGKYTYDEAGDVRAVDLAAFQREEKQNRLVWPVAKTPGVSVGKKKSQKLKSAATVENAANDAVAFLGQFLLALTQAKTREEQQFAALDRNAVTDKQCEQLRKKCCSDYRAIYRTYCKYDDIFPFGFIDDLPFDSPEGCQIVSVTEKGDTTNVVLQRPEVTYERICYTIQKTKKGYQITARNIVEDTENVAAIQFMRQVLGAMRDVQAQDRQLSADANARRISWDVRYKKGNELCAALHQAYCPPSDKPYRDGSTSLFSSCDPQLCKIINVTEKGKKTFIVYQEPTMVLDEQTQEWITLHEWLRQDSSRVADLSSARSYFRTVMQCTVVQTADGLKMIDTIKKYMEGENRFVNYIRF